MLKKDRAVIFVSGALVMLLVAGFLLPGWATFLIAISLAEGLVALGLVVLKRTGLISFGQGLYYCIGGYSTAIAGHYFGISDAFSLVLFALAAAGLVSVLTGALLCRYREIFFAMLTLAFSMILYGVLVNNAAMGSTDGFDVVSICFFGCHPAGKGLSLAIYCLICPVALVAALLIHKYFRSEMGWAGEAIRENEIRVEYLGVWPEKVLFFGNILAALLAALGGAFAAFASGHVDPNMAYWTTSGNFVFIMLLGGTDSVAAPFVGALIFELIRTFASDYVPYSWHMILGTVLLLIILFQPRGLWSLLPKRKAGVV